MIVRPLISLRLTGAKMTCYNSCKTILCRDSTTRLRSFGTIGSGTGPCRTLSRSAPRCAFRSTCSIDVVLFWFNKYIKRLHSTYSRYPKNKGCYDITLPQTPSVTDKYSRYACVNATQIECMEDTDCRRVLQHVSHRVLRGQIRPVGLD